MTQGMKMGIRDVTAGVTISVRWTDYRWWKIRMSASVLLIRLAAWIGGLGFEADLEEET